MTKIKIASWNINSVRLRIAQVATFANEHAPDIITLQEIKCLEDQFPHKECEALGYSHIEINGQKGMHGTATISKIPLTRIDTDFCPRGEARHVSTRVEVGAGKDFELHNFYIPAGGDEPDPDINPKFAHKLTYLDNITGYFAGRSAENGRHVLTGDFNIAPHENDVWSHKQLLKVVSHTPVEVDKLAAMQAAHDFTDCARMFADDSEKIHSWWSYRSKDINKSDRGRRLDHIWVSPALKDAAYSSGAAGHEIHRPCRFWERPSDHAPVTQILNLG
jgi:exodeoxyribonuclease-3